MKAAPFTYLRPESLDEALRELADRAPDARPLAGGQSLAPMLHMRLMRPDAIVDLNRVPELGGVRADGATTVVGAMTRYVELAESPLIAERLPLIREAIGYVGDVQVRNRGTIGGSLAQADPTGEMPLCCLVLDAEVVIRGAGGERRLGVDAFITGSYATVLEPDELVVEIRFPPAPPVSAFAETGRKHNDFAIAAVAATGSVDPDGRWRDLRIGVGGVDERPVPLRTPAALLEGTALDDAAIDAAVAPALDVLEPVDDVRAGAEYRGVVAVDLARRVLRRMRDQREALHG